MILCSNRVVWRDARRKGSGNPYQRVKSWHSWAHDLPVPEDAVPCTGTVKISVEVEYDGYGSCCCNSGTVRVSYKCDTCQSGFYPELPQDADSLAAFLNEGTLSKAKVGRMRKAYVAEQERLEAARVQMMIEWDLRQAKEKKERAAKRKQREAKRKAKKKQ